MPVSWPADFKIIRVHSAIFDMQLRSVPRRKNWVICQRWAQSNQAICNGRYVMAWTASQKWTCPDQNSCRESAMGSLKSALRCAECYLRLLFFVYDEHCDLAWGVMRCATSSRMTAYPDGLVSHIRSPCMFLSLVPQHDGYFKSHHACTGCYIIEESASFLPEPRNFQWIRNKLRLNVQKLTLPTPTKTTNFLLCFCY